MTYRQWVFIEGCARCSRLAAHGLSFYPLSEEQRRWLDEYDELRSDRTWRGVLRKYIAAALLVTAEQFMQVAPLAAARDGPA